MQIGDRFVACDPLGVPFDCEVVWTFNPWFELELVNDPESRNLSEAFTSLADAIEAAATFQP